MEQKEILQRYLEGYQRKKENLEELANDFMNLKRQSAKHKIDNHCTTKTAEYPENFKKNRYKDILPFDHSRVKLSLITSDEDTDFINANFIKGVYCPRAYIATQGPLPHTVVDFWRMIWEYNVGIIVMACMEFEMGKKKCERYWAEAGCEVLKCGPFSITCSHEEKKKDYIIRTLVATYGSEIRIVYQFHYKNWPDHDVPSSVEHILGMIEDIRVLQCDDTPPICFHCSAGCGRTGVLCVVDYIWRLLKDKIIPVNFSIYSIIQEMRTQRSSLVQTKEQYELVYRAVICLFKKELERSNTKDLAQTNVLGVAPCPRDTNDSLTELAEGYTGEYMMQEETNTHSWHASTMASNTGIKSNSTMGPSSPSKIYKMGDMLMSNNICIQTTEIQSFPRPLPRTILPKNAQDPKDSRPCPQPPTGDRRSYSGHAPLLQTKSTPSELHRQSFISEQITDASDICPHTPRNVISPTGKQRFFANHHQGSMFSGSLGNITSDHSNNTYVRLTEDPYFSPSSSSDPCSPKFPDFCVEVICPDNPLPQAKNMEDLIIPLASSYDTISQDNQFCKDEKLQGTEAPPLNSINCTVSVVESNEESPPPLPERTPESFMVATEIDEPSQMPTQLQPNLQAKAPSERIGISSEWAGVSQLKTDDFRLMARSKSVKVRGSKIEKTQDRSTSPLPPPIPARTENSFIIAEEAINMEYNVPDNTQASPLMETEITGSVSSAEPEKKMTRKKSLKILRNVKKNVCSLTKSESDSPHTSGAFSFLNFGFGNRFAKPKGPRNPPTTWNL
ncbi:tyrosine-protein phosphatase non-receptor type 22 [Hyperolius riggenbachi]|uniref:tyrosine-protein phosphatase non-receptor type 22 n=1 Tax=Hyperolius riggenbachi TaxID=752182 RepID=UPI0035A321A4